MNEDILHAQLVEERRREKDQLISNARQLALEEWMELVTASIIRQGSEGWHKVNNALEEYKRVSKP